MRTYENFSVMVLYVNPYMVVTPRGCTRHHYNGSQRIAARLGEYWNCYDTFADADDELAIADSLWLHTTTIMEPSHQDMEGDHQYVNVDGAALPIVSYGPYICSIRSMHGGDLLWYVFDGDFHETDGDVTNEGIYYYHPDHLGSSSWITGDAFIARFQNNEIPLFNYIFDNPKMDGNLSGRNEGNCDFKFGGDVNRGMPLSILGGKIGTARDVGNFAAGYLFGVHGIPFSLTRIAFDCLQKGIEPPVSMSAQNIGYFTRYYRFLIQQKSCYGIK